MSSNHEKKHFFIYEKRELVLFSFIFIIALLFVFTLGIHFGKKLRFSIQQKTKTTSFTIPSTPEHLPSPEELSEQKTSVQEHFHSTLQEALSVELKKTDLKLKTPRPTQLPQEAQSKQKGSTSLEEIHRSSK